jgi:hypothetical protein
MDNRDKIVELLTNIGSEAFKDKAEDFLSDIIDTTTDTGSKAIFNIASRALFGGIINEEEIKLLTDYAIQNNIDPTEPV